MDKKPTKHLHAGHRSRMRRRFLHNGLDGFVDHEVLELLLFYAVPRQDVNPMAHALLDKFDSLPGVLDASIEDLCTIHGVGPKIARFLTLIPDVLLQTEHCLFRPTHSTLRSPKEFATLISHRSARPSPGDTFVIPLDAHYGIMAVYPYPSFDELDVREVALRALFLGSKLVVLAECVEKPSSLLSDDRAEQLVILQQGLAALDVRLADHYRFDPSCSDPRSGANAGLLLPL